MYALAHTQATSCGVTRSTVAHHHRQGHAFHVERKKGMNMMTNQNSPIQSAWPTPSCYHRSRRKERSVHVATRQKQSEEEHIPNEHMREDKGGHTSSPKRRKGTGYGMLKGSALKSNPASSNWKSMRPLGSCKTIQQRRNQATKTGVNVRRNVRQNEIAPAEKVETRDTCWETWNKNKARSYPYTPPPPLSRALFTHIVEHPGCHYPRQTTVAALTARTLGAKGVK